jgi:stage V sporulation protein S
MSTSDPQPTILHESAVATPPPFQEEPVLRVGAGSSVKDVAGSISQALLTADKVTLRAVGAGAVNQMLKAAAVARSYTALRGLDLVCRPGFENVESRDGRISAVVLHVQVS